MIEFSKKIQHQYNLYLYPYLMMSYIIMYKSQGHFTAEQVVLLWYLKCILLIIFLCYSVPILCEHLPLEQYLTYFDIFSLPSVCCQVHTVHRPSIWNKLSGVSKEATGKQRSANISWCCVVFSDFSFGLFKSFKNSDC